MRRRIFLQYTLWGTVLSYLGIQNDVLAEIVSDIKANTTGEALKDAQSIFPNHVADVVRPEDLLSLRFEFINLSFKPGAAAKLVRIDQSKDAYVRVIFQPQHITEEAYDINQSAVPTPPIPSHIAGSSRLVFSLPKGVNEVSYDLPSLLSWQQWKPSLAPVALPPKFSIEGAVLRQMASDAGQNLVRSQIGGYDVRLSRQLTNSLRQSSLEKMTAREFDLSPVVIKDGIKRSKPDFKPQIIQPKENHTAIEAPAKLFLSPHELNAWAHSVVPVKREDNQVVRTELWHTRLGVLSKANKDGTVFVDEHNTFYRTVRAVWSPDYKPKAAGKCGEGTRKEALTDGERNQIVHLTSNYDLDYTKPVQANRFMLSSMGAWLDLQGDWDIPSGSPLGLESWTHRATLGRDHFVRVVCKGYLFPFGHRASLITITERQVEGSPVPVAYLRYRQFVVVREPEKQYAKQSAGSDRDAVEGRTLPFRSVRLRTLVTPSLNPVPDKADGWIMADQQDFLFKIEAEDWDGRRCEFTAPLNFMPNTLAENQGGIGSLFQSGFVKARADLYNDKPEYRLRRERPLAGQTVAYAPSTEPGNTSFETELVELGGAFRKDTKKGELLFCPFMQKARVRLAAANRLTGGNAAITIRLFNPFIENGFGTGNDKGEVFAEVPDAIHLNFPAERAGGVATPNMNLRGLSRKFGILGGSGTDPAWKQDLAEVAKGELSSTFFSRFFDNAKLLGDISLADIIKPSFNNGKNIPRFQSRGVYDKNGALTAMKILFEWQPLVKDSHAFVASLNNIPATLSLKAEITTPVDGSQPRSLTSGELKNFRLDLVPGMSFMKLKIESFRFATRDRQKPDFSVDGLEVEFRGEIKFLSMLQGKVAKDGFSDPPSLAVTSDGVRLGYTLQIPSITAGAFALENISFTAGLLLPFTGAPIDMRLAFSERNNPFMMTYLIFAGGGFFGISLGTDGLHSVEAALEFGGNLTLNLGVASGKAYLFVGIYFRIREVTVDSQKKMMPQLEGYVRSGAALQVLGLITVSVQFRFGLTYEIKTGNATGTGTVTVEVDVAFFSKSVNITLSKSFAGSDPQTTGLFNDKAGGMLAWLDEGNNAGSCGYWDEYCGAFAGGKA